MKMSKLATMALSLTVMVSVIGMNPLIPSAGPAEAAIKKYERKSITILGEGDNILNRLFTKLFKDMGRFDYYTIPIGRDSQLEALNFLVKVKGWYNENKKDIAAGKTIPDTKFKDKIITKEEAEKVVNAAYAMVPVFDISDVRTVSPVVEEDTDDNDPFGIKSFTFFVDIGLQTKIYDIANLKQHALLNSKQSLLVTVKKHFRKSKGSYAADSFLNAQREQLLRIGVFGVLNSLTPDQQDRIVRLMSPDEIGRLTSKANADFQNLNPVDQSRAFFGIRTAISDGFDPSDPYFIPFIKASSKEIKDMNAYELDIIENAYDKKESTGLGTMAGEIVKSISSGFITTGIMPDTVKQAKSLDSFLIKGPAKDAKPSKDSVSIGFGADTGVDINNWYRVQERVVDDNTGIETLNDKAWVKIRKVLDKKSEAQAIILNSAYEDDDQMVEYPMLGSNFNIKPGVDMFNLKDMAVGASVVFESDLSPFINRSTNREVTIPELYGFVELGGAVPLSANILDKKTSFTGKLKLGLGQRMYMRQMMLTYGINVGAQGFMGDGWGKDQSAGAAGGGLSLGLGYEFSPHFSADLQLPIEGYMGITKDYDDFYILLSPRLGFNLQF